MSNVLSSKDFGLKLYNRFPYKYREDDAKLGYPLKRYLETLADGGFKYSIDEINGILSLVDPESADPKVLPVLFEQYGLELFNGIPDNYLRYLLPRVGEAWTKKGSLSVVEFITSSLAGVKASTLVHYDEKENPTVGVRLEMDYALGDYFPEPEQLIRLLEQFVPFYCDLSLLYSYIFLDDPYLNAGDEGYMVLKSALEERASILSGTTIMVDPVLNMMDRTLNNEILLNTFLVLSHPEYRRDTIKYTLEDKVSFGGFEKDLTKMKLAPVSVKGVFKGKVDNVDILHYSFAEEKGISIDDALFTTILKSPSIREVGRIGHDIVELDRYTYRASDRGSISSKDKLTEILSVNYLVHETGILDGDEKLKYNMSMASKESESLSTEDSEMIIPRTTNYDYHKLVHKDHEEHSIKQQILEDDPVSADDLDIRLSVNSHYAESERLLHDEKDSLHTRMVGQDRGTLRGVITTKQDRLMLVAGGLLEEKEVVAKDIVSRFELSTRNEETISFNSTLMERSFTNSASCVLNGFHTNTIFSGFDTIKVGNTTQCVFN